MPNWFAWKAVERGLVQRILFGPDLSPPSGHQLQRAVDHDVEAFNIYNVRQINSTREMSRKIKSRMVREKGVNPGRVHDKNRWSSIGECRLLTIILITHNLTWVVPTIGKLIGFHT